MDISMPFMGGMEATELIRSYEMHRSLTTPPIFDLTAYASESCLEKLYNNSQGRISDRRQRTVLASWDG
jgi:CheY-like chemotaxis protein